MDEYRCLCFSCSRIFIIKTDNPETRITCPGCRGIFGEAEKIDIDVYYDYRRHKHRRKKYAHSNISDTYLQKTAEYCIVPWIRNPQPTIIPDRNFHEFYQDMKARMQASTDKLS